MQAGIQRDADHTNIEMGKKQESPKISHRIHMAIDVQKYLNSFSGQISSSQPMMLEQLAVCERIKLNPK